MKTLTRDELIEAATELGVSIRMVWSVRDTLLLDTAREKELTRLGNELTVMRIQILQEAGVSP